MQDIAATQPSRASTRGGVGATGSSWPVRRTTARCLKPLRQFSLSYPKGLKLGRKTTKVCKGIAQTSTEAQRATQADHAVDEKVPLDRKEGQEMRWPEKGTPLPGPGCNQGKGSCRWWLPYGSRAASSFPACRTARTDQVTVVRCHGWGGSRQCTFPLPRLAWLGPRWRSSKMSLRSRRNSQKVRIGEPEKVFVKLSGFPGLT